MEETTVEHKATPYRRTFFPTSSKSGPHTTNGTSYNPADRRAKQVLSEYRSNFKQLDNKFTSDSEEVRNGMRGSFSKAHDRFYTKGRHPISGRAVQDIE